MYNIEVMREILTEAGYKLHDRGLEWRCKPIYRDSDNETSLRIIKATGGWTDFPARIGGAFHKLVQISLSLSEEKAKKFLEDRQFYSYNPETKRKPVLSMVKSFPEEMLQKLIQDDSYWVKRGVKKTTLKTLRGGVGATGKMYQRYVFPIFNKQGKILGFSGRCLKDMTDEERKATGRNKWKHLGEKKFFDYPLFFVKQEIEKAGEIILVESIGDFLALYEAGIRNVLVLFGVYLQPELLSILIQLDPKRIIIATNNDSENKSVGNKAAVEIQKKLWNYFDQEQIIIGLPEKNDFGAMEVEEILEWNNKYGNVK